MKTAIVLFAGVMTASAALAAMNDRMAEERYRAKYGRNTPAEEARKRSDIKDTDKNPIQDCPGNAWGSGILDDHVYGSAHEARFRAKYGRGSSA